MSRVPLLGEVGMPVHRWVAHIDLLGTKARMRNDFMHSGRFHDDLAAINDLRTIWAFLGRLVEGNRSLYFFGGSDSLFLVAERDHAADFFRTICAFMQVAVGVRYFPARVGLGYGWVATSDEGQPSIEQQLSGMDLDGQGVVPRYICGQAIVHAVESESRLKGSRICFQQREEFRETLELLNVVDVEPLLIERPADGCIELNWCDLGFTRALFDSVRERSQQAWLGPEDGFWERFFGRYLQPLPHLKDEYVKAMVGLGVELGFI